MRVGQHLVIFARVTLIVELLDIKAGRLLGTLVGDPSVYSVNIGCFDDINFCDYLATAINDGVSMSLAADDAFC